MNSDIETLHDFARKPEENFTAGVGEVEVLNAPSQNYMIAKSQSSRAWQANEGKKEQCRHRSKGNKGGLCRERGNERTRKWIAVKKKEDAANAVIIETQQATGEHAEVEAGYVWVEPHMQD